MFSLRFEIKQKLKTEKKKVKEEKKKKKQEEEQEKKKQSQVTDTQVVSGPVSRLLAEIVFFEERLKKKFYRCTVMK